jgi:hypothetical protein
LIEACRRQTLCWLEEGYCLNEVGRIISSAPIPVMRWRDAIHSGGEEPLKVAAPALTVSQQRLIAGFRVIGPS